VLRYALKRLLGAIPTLLLVIVLAFLMVHAAPGGPFDAERVLPPEIEANIAKAYHLDEPLPAQLIRYLTGVAQGDLGPSYRYRDHTVSELIGSAFPLSLKLGAMAMLLATVIGISAGSFAALNRNSFVDRVTMALSMTGISVPVFVVAPVLVLISLALPQIAYIAKLTRASMIDVLASNFVRTARGQGLGAYAVVRYHALKPAMLPVLSYMGPAIAAVLTGSVVVEEVFGIPGLGQFFVRGALNRDYTLVLGIVIFYASLVVLLNLVVDILYGVIDPRIRQR